MGVICSRRLSWLSQSRCCPRTVPPTPRGFCPALVPTKAGLHVRVRQGQAEAERAGLLHCPGAKTIKGLA